MTDIDTVIDSGIPPLQGPDATLKRAASSVYAAAGLPAPKVMMAASPFAAALLEADGTDEDVASRILDAVAAPLMQHFEDEIAGRLAIDRLSAPEASVAMAVSKWLDRAIDDLLSLRRGAHALPDPDANYVIGTSAESTRIEPVASRMATAIDRLTNIFWGASLESAPMKSLAAIRRTRPDAADWSGWDALQTLSAASSGIVFKRDVAIVAAPALAPIPVDGLGRPHAADGPLLYWSDGAALFALHGVPVPARYVLMPHEIGTGDIAHERNLEIRRTLIDRYGVGRYLKSIGAPVNADDAIAWALERAPEPDAPALAA